MEEDHLVLALHCGNPLARRHHLSLADLRDEPFVIYSSNAVPSLHAILMFACESAGFTPKVSQEAVQVQTVISLVQSGLGIALVSSVATRNGPSHVQFCQLADLEHRAPIALATAHSPEWETAASRHFRKLAREHHIVLAKTLV